MLIIEDVNRELLCQQVLTRIKALRRRSEKKQHRKTRTGEYTKGGLHAHAQRRADDARYCGSSRNFFNNAVDQPAQ